MKYKINNNNQFTAVIWKEGEYYVSRSLNVEVSSFGKTYEEALNNLNEALELYLEDADANEVTHIETPSITITHPRFSYA